MNAPNSAGERFRAALEQEHPLQVVGVINAYAARLAEATGFRALYISGGGVAAGSCGIPDLGITTREDVLTDVRRVVEITDLPVLVDIDTGWGGAFNIARTIKAMERAGAAGCPHRRPGVRQTLRSSARQGRGARRGDGGPHPGRGECPDRRGFRRHGAHRRAGGRRPRRRYRPRPPLHRSRGGHALSGGPADTRPVPAICGRGAACPSWPTSPSSASRRC